MKTIKFGKLADGRSAGLYILESSDGMRAAVTDYGAALVSLAVPDGKGRLRDVVLGHDDASGYETGSGHIGASVGRFANRIAGACFELNGQTYELTANNGANCLHGGRDFFKNRLWGVKIDFTSVRSGDIMAAYASESISDKDPSRGLKGLHDDSITFCLDSPDGDQGFPGNMHIEVTYSLPGNGKLRIDYRAVSDAATPVSFTNHSYFNLNGHDSGTVMGHVARINAEYYTPVDAGLIPLEEPAPVAGTPFDFREDKMLGRDINTSIDSVSGQVMLNNHSLVTEMDEELENGVLHVINHVLTRSNNLIAGEMEKHPQFSIFLQGLVMTGLVDSLSQLERKGIIMPKKYTGKGNIDGISGYVDKSRFMGNHSLREIRFRH